MSFKRKQNCFDKGRFGDRMFAHNGAKVQSHFYPSDLVTSTGDQEIHSVSGRLPDYLGELACMLITSKICRRLQHWRLKNNKFARLSTHAE